jgi:hypothetical protein
MVTTIPQQTTRSGRATAARASGPEKPEFIRLPLPGARCPYTGLSRTSLAELCAPCPANDNRPPVKSVVIRKRGALRGIRLVSYDSLMAHLASLSNDGGEGGED